MSQDNIEPKLQVLIEEWCAGGIGKKIYNEICAIVKAAIIGGGYPSMYSPLGIWDEEAYYTLANDFIMEKLLKRNYVEYLLQANTSIRIFRKHVEAVFKRFLVSKKKRTVLDNLFRRAYQILREDGRFKCFITATKKAHSLWGLAAWDTKEVFNSREEDLVQIGLSLGGIKVTEYRPDAKKISHVVSDKELSDYMHDLFAAVDSLLSLPLILTVFKYRFNLLEIKEVSLEEPAFVDEEGNILTVGDTLGAGEASTAALETDEAAIEALRSLSPRQKQILMEFQGPEATLSSIGERVGCSKSTVDNELRRISSTLAEVADDGEQARAIYKRIIEILQEEN